MTLDEFFQDTKKYKSLSDMIIRGYDFSQAPEEIQDAVEHALERFWKFLGGCAFSELDLQWYSMTEEEQDAFLNEDDPVDYAYDNWVESNPNITIFETILPGGFEVVNAE